MSRLCNANHAVQLLAHGDAGGRPGAIGLLHGALLCGAVRGYWAMHPDAPDPIGPAEFGLLDVDEFAAWLARHPVGDEMGTLLVDRDDLDTFVDRPAADVMAAGGRVRSELVRAVNLATAAGTLLPADARAWIAAHVEGWVVDGSGIIGPSGRRYEYEAISKAVQRRRPG